VDLTGQVAVVTGAGRGIGRAHALRLAACGAAVLVNDRGVEIDGAFSDGFTDGASPADEVVAEITSAGGRAVASTDSVAAAEGGTAIVDRALQEFGRVDIVVHNAGIVKAGPVATQPWADIADVLSVHLHGAYHVLRAAWPQMATQQYGRVVLTTSGAIFGHPMVHAYAAAKLGVIGLVRSAQAEADMAGLDIRINALAPIGATRMARDEQKQRWGDLLDPDAVAAVVTWLASPACDLHGETLHAGGSHFCRIFLGQTQGWAKGVPGLTPDEIGDHIDEAFALDGFVIPASTNASTDALFERATGNTAKLSGDEILPSASR
jgi:NAD(P)-dependent dehydrogenase (short-subunit alcohol dehydrogenase family)